MINVLLEKDKKKVEKQIKGLEIIIKNDVSKKDKKIHQDALKKLKKYLEINF